MSVKSSVSGNVEQVMVRLKVEECKRALGMFQVDISNSYHTAVWMPHFKKMYQKQKHQGSSASRRATCYETASRRATCYETASRRATCYETASRRATCYETASRRATCYETASRRATCYETASIFVIEVCRLPGLHQLFKVDVVLSAPYSLYWAAFSPTLR